MNVQGMVLLFIPLNNFESAHCSPDSRCHCPDKTEWSVNICCPPQQIFVVQAIRSYSKVRKKGRELSVSQRAVTTDKVANKII